MEIFQTWPRMYFSKSIACFPGNDDMKQSRKSFLKSPQNQNVLSWKVE